MFRTARRIRFLFMAPVILAICFVVNLVTSPHDWWVQWVGLGLGIAWVLTLFRLLGDAVVVGGLAALGAYLWRRRRQPGSR